MCQPGGGGQAYVNEILENEQCSQVEDYNSTALGVIGNCSMNANGAYCGQLAYNGTINSVLNNVERHCNSSHANQCNQTCASSIKEAKRLVGCCLTVYNTSASTYYSSFPDAFSYDLWTSCGVELPGVCQNTLNLNLSRSTVEDHYNVTTESNNSGSNSIMGGVTIWNAAFIVTVLICILL